MQLVALSFALLKVSTGQSEQTYGTCVIFQNFPGGQRAVVVVVGTAVVVVVGGTGSPVDSRTTFAGEVWVPKYIICVFELMTADWRLFSPLSSTTQASCWLKFVGLMLI